jgi:hypothetical protein
MDRRIALKNMGLAFGYTVAAPTIISLIQSCRQEAGPDWVPSFFSPGEGAVIRELADIILPKTDTPSASEIGVHAFIDGYLSEVSSVQEQSFFKKCMEKFLDTALTESGKEAPEDLLPGEIEQVFVSSLDISEEEQDKIDDLLEYFPKVLSNDTVKEVVQGGPMIHLEDGMYRYAFAAHFRDAVIKAYKTSEYIGEEVLAYLQIPGGNIGCGDLDELTGGRAWSL